MREIRTSGSVRDGVGNVPIYSALRLDQAFVFFLEAGVGGIAIGEQHRARREGAEKLVDMDRAPALGIGKADFLLFAEDRPEVALVHLAAPATAGLDRGPVHGQHPGSADALELGCIDGCQQGDGLLHEPGEPGATDPQSLRHHPLVLPVERQVIEVFVQNLERQAIASHHTQHATELPDHHQCFFGKWYDGIGQKLLGTQPEFQRVAAPHAAAHSAGKALLEALDRGDKTEARHQMAVLREAKDQTISVLKALLRVLTPEEAD